MYMHKVDRNIQEQLGDSNFQPGIEEICVTLENPETVIER